MTFLFAADIDLYSSSPKVVRKKIQNSQKLLESKKYISAYNSLNDSNPYIILKKTEILVSYSTKITSPKNFILSENGKTEAIQFESSVFSENQGANEKEKSILALARAFYTSKMLRVFPNNQDFSVDSALNDYDFAFSRGVYSALYALDYASILSAVGNVEESCKWFGEAAQLYQTNGDAWYNYAYMLFALENYEKCLEASEKAAQCYKNNPEYAEEAYLMRGDAYINLSNFEKAKESFEKAISVNPSEAIPHLRLGVLLVQTEELPRGRAELQKAYELSPKNYRILSQLLQTLTGAGYVEEAEDFCNKNIVLQAGNDYAVAFLYYYLANIQIANDKKKEALSALDKAEEFFAKAGIIDGANSIAELRKQCL